jgi:O-antigen/teichoic acid export membrane protein
MYCGKFTVSTLLAFQLNATDILVAGVLFSSEAVADYVVAARIAGLLPFLQISTLKWFAPRAGHLLETRQFATLRREVELCRRLVIGCGAMTIAGALCAAPFVFPFLGKYAPAQILLVWLAIPVLVQSFYATSDRLLIISGQPNVSLLLTGSSFLTLVIMPFFTAPLVGLVSIPLAMLSAAILFQPMVAARVWAKFDIQTIRTVEIATIACGGTALAAYAATQTLLSAVVACTVTVAMAVYFILTAFNLSSTSELAV